MKLIRSILLVMATGLAFSTPGFSEPVTQKDIAQKPAVSQAADASATVNINSASADVMADRLNGVGIKKAQAIVSFREKNGPFKTAEDLLNVAGIGEATLEKNRGIISIN